ncbi:MAG: PIN domain-containing protein [Planctomycetes bacterium]|nr:PIN domain-containing protein [Planctomycetota bacterium]
MIAVDTNVLVHAHRRDSTWHSRAAAAMRRLTEGPADWGLPWPCVHEFLAIVTHPKIYAPPSTMAQAIEQVDSWLAAPGAQLLAEATTHWSTLRDILMAGRQKGPQVHDARIAAICRQHGVRELWTADRDFSRIANFATHNPLRG